MFNRRVLAALTAAAVATIPASRAHADAGDFIGGVVTGVIGSAIVNDANRNNANRNRSRSNNRVVVRKRYVPVDPAAAAKQNAARAANREMQTALNYFGFPAGTPDGVVGRNTRSAVSSYQAFMGYPATGNITDFERDLLVGAYNRGLAGSYDTQQLIGTDPMGVKALLLEQRDIALGLPRAGASGATVAPAGYAGLPPEVSAAIDEIASSSDPSAEQLLQRSGFIQLADLNGDGSTDYIIDSSYSGSSFWCNDVQCKSIVFASTPQGYQRNDLLARNPQPDAFECFGGSCRVGGTVMASADPGGQMPPGGGQQAGQEPVVSAKGAVSAGALPVFNVAAPADEAIALSTHCDKLGLEIKAKGGYTTRATMTETSDVIGEQFCLVRDEAMSNADDLAGALQGVTPQQIAAQCAAYGPALKPFAASVGDKARDAVIRDVKSFASDSGADAAQLRLTAEICLGHGYGTDDLDTAMGSALLLVALGEPAYGELIGHHLAQGFGVAEDRSLAMDWYRASVDALTGGAKPVFAPAFDDRAGLMQQALFVMEGGGQASLPGALPTFKISE